VTGSESTFLRVPSDVTLFPGAVLRLNCTSNLQNSVLWRFKNRVGDPVPMTLRGVLVPSFQRLFRIESNSRYQHDLVATQAQVGLSDTYCAKYHCIENNGYGAARTADVASKYFYRFSPLGLSVVMKGSPWRAFWSIINKVNKVTC